MAREPMSIPEVSCPTVRTSRRRRLRRQDSQGCQTGRPSGRGTDQDRTGRQSQDRESARANDPGAFPASRRRGDRMKRREFIALVGGAAASLPLATRAQQAGRVRRIGVLMRTNQNDPVAQTRVAGFREGLAQFGWSEGGNLAIEWRWSGGDIARTREYAAELVQLAPDVLLANGTPATAALKQATTAIPIVFAVVNDPVAQGFIASMAH